MADNPSNVGQREIRKDQVNAAAFERRHKIIAVLHAGGRTSDAVGFQGGLNERGIVWIILQVQDVERGFHGCVALTWSKLLRHQELQVLFSSHQPLIDTALLDLRFVLEWKNKTSRHRPPPLPPIPGRHAGE